MLNKRQTEIINGSLLGDGMIWTNFVDPLMRFQTSQSKFDKEKQDKKQYIMWFVSELLELGCSVRFKSKKGTGVCNTGKIYHKYSFATKGCKFWRDVEKEWYLRDSNGNYIKDHKNWRIKIVPRRIRLTPLSLCVWHMDDGYANPIDANIELNTQGFSEEDIEFLIERLDVDLGIKASKKDDQGKFKIFIGTKHYFSFIEIIRPHVQWDCFKYKLDVDTYCKIPQVGENHSQSKLTKKEFRKIFALSESGLMQKDIAEKIETSKTNISLILSGRNWNHLGLGEPPKPPKPKPRVKQKELIIQLRNEGLLQKEIAAKIGCNQSTVSRILRNEKQNRVGQAEYKHCPN